MANESEQSSGGSRIGITGSGLADQVVGEAGVARLEHAAAEQEQGLGVTPAMGSQLTLPLPFGGGQVGREFRGDSFRQRSCWGCRAGGGSDRGIDSLDAVSQIALGTEQLDLVQRDQVVIPQLDVLAAQELEPIVCSSGGEIPGDQVEHDRQYPPVHDATGGTTRSEGGPNSGHGRILGVAGVSS